MNTVLRKCKFGTFMIPDVRDLISYTLTGDRILDMWVVNHMLHYAPLNSTVIDVGAYIGDVLIPIAIERQDLWFEAFECNPEIADILEENLKLNNVADRVVVHRKAVYDGTCSTICFPLPDGKISGGINYGAFGVDPGRSDGLMVPAVALDELDLKGSIGVIKIDAQGADLAVLRGSKKLIARCKPVVLFEYELGVTGVKDGKDYAPLKQPWSEYQKVIDQIDYNVTGHEHSNFLLLPKRR